MLGPASNATNARVRKRWSARAFDVLWLGQKWMFGQKRAWGKKRALRKKRGKKWQTLSKKWRTLCQKQT